MYVPIILEVYELTTYTMFFHTTVYENKRYYTYKARLFKIAFTCQNSDNLFVRTLRKQETFTVKL